MTMPKTLIDVDKRLGVIQARLDRFADCKFVIYNSMTSQYVPVRAGWGDTHFSKDEVIEMLYILIDMLDVLIVFSSSEESDIDCIDVVLNGKDVKEILTTMLVNLTRNSKRLKFKKHVKSLVDP